MMSPCFVSLMLYLGEYRNRKVRIINITFIMFFLGLVAVGEKAQKRSGHYIVMKDLSGENLTLKN